MTVIYFFIALVLISCVVEAQIDGEFWWLNEKLTALNGVEAPQAKFERLTGFENDETDAIVFRDNESSDRDTRFGLINKFNNSHNSEELSFQINIPDVHNNTVKDENSKKNESDTLTNLVNYEAVNNSENITLYNKPFASLDSHPISFPDEHKIVWPDFKIANPTSSKLVNQNSSNKVKTLLPGGSKDISSTSELKLIFDAENICNYMSNDDCKERKGLIYQNTLRQKKNSGYWKKENICCVLPLSTTESSQKTISNYKNKIKTKENVDHKIRFIRSTTNERSSTLEQNQRNFILNRKLKSSTETSIAPTKLTRRIVSPDYDYADPYWNIKNSNLKPTPNLPQEYDSVHADYDYASELPKPGLLSWYSEQSSRRPFDSKWMPYEENRGLVIGYGSGIGNTYTTLDPRRGDRVPVVLSTSSEEIHNSESQIVTYQSNSDFPVLQDFKLLNLIRNKTRIRNKNFRKTTTENYDSLESVSILPITRPSYGSSTEVVYDDVDDLERKPFENCDKRNPDYESEADNKEICIGDYPWLLLVVRKGKPKSLCSATLVHPRAALTAASCVYGSLPGQILVRAGELDLDETANSQQRSASSYIHPLYRTGNLHHNLAILYWSRPFRAGASIKPACLRQIKSGDTCNFVGWGGLDQVRSRPKMQRVTILKHRACTDHLSKAGFTDDLPNGAICITTKSRGCVSDVGSALFCHDGSAVAAVGVTVWRSRCDSTPILLVPAREWTEKTLTKLGIN